MRGLFLTITIASLALTACHRTQPRPTATERPPLPVHRPFPSADHFAFPTSVARTSAGDYPIWLEEVTPGTKSPMALFYATHMANPTRIVQGELMANWADPPALMRTAGGAFIATYAKRLPNNGEGMHLFVSTSPDGVHWKELGRLHTDITETEHGFVALTPHEDMSFRAFWLDGRHGAESGATSLYTALIDGEIHNEERLDPRVCDCCSTSAALTSTGPIIAYRDRSADEIRDISVIRKTAAGWSEPVRVSEDNWKIAGCPVNGPSFATANKTVAIAWLTLTPTNEGLIKFARSHDGGATFTPAIVLNPAPDSEDDAVIGRVDVQLEVSGKASVSWVAKHGANYAVHLTRIGADGAVSDAVAFTAPDTPTTTPHLVTHNNVASILWSTRSQTFLTPLTR